jgi:hypothetical protein
MSKLTAFDYVVNHIQIWYQEQGGDMENNDLSKLKITKLLFFTCAATTGPSNPGLLILLPCLMATLKVTSKVKWNSQYFSTLRKMG